MLSLRSTARYAALPLLASAVLLVGFSDTHAQGDSLQDSPLTSTLDPQTVVEWMELLRQRVQADRIGAPQGARLYGYAGIVTYESVVLGAPEFLSLGNQLNQLPELPYPEDDAVHDWLAVHDAAFSSVMGELLNTPETDDAFEARYDENIAARIQEVGEDVVERSVTYGQQLAEALLDWAKDDGFRDMQGLEYIAPMGDMMWVETTEGSGAVGAFWSQLRPFILQYSNECSQPFNIIYSEEPDSAFYAQAMEVMEVGNRLTEEEREIATFWVDTPAITPTPAGHWISIANQMVEQLDVPLDRAAMMYGMLGVTLSDTFLSLWTTKYQVNLQRPVTYINRHISRRWQPFIQTPPFPEYPSGHSGVSAAGADILTFMFGATPFTDRTHENDTGALRSFITFEQAAREAAISRLYGGIHFRTAIENGYRQGQCVAEVALDRIQMNQFTQGE